MTMTFTPVTTGATPDVNGIAGTGIVHGEDSRSWDVALDAVAAPDATQLNTGVTWTPDWISVTPYLANGGGCYTVWPYIVNVVPAVVTALGVVTSPTLINFQRGAGGAVAVAAFRLTIHRIPDPEV